MGTALQTLGTIFLLLLNDVIVIMEDNNLSEKYEKFISKAVIRNKVSSTFIRR